MADRNKKGTLKIQSAFLKPVRLLRAQDRILAGFRDTEFDDLLGWDLDLRAGRGIAPDPGLAVDENQFAQARKRKAIFGILVSELRDVLDAFP